MVSRATRPRSSRVSPPPPDNNDTPPAARTRMATRSKRQKAAEKKAEPPAAAPSSESDDDEDEEEEEEEEEPSDTAQIAAQLDSDLPFGVATVKSKKGLLATVTPARRGAPMKGSPLSIAASISSRRQNLDDEDEDDNEDEDEEEEDDDEGDDDEDGPTSDAHQEPLAEDEERGEGSEGEDQDQIVDEAEQAKRLLKSDYILKFAAASNEILKLLSAPDANSALFKARLKVQRDSFFALRRIYEDPSDEPFARWDWADDHSRGGSTARTIVVFGNVATALEMVERALSDKLEPLPILEVLDRVFPGLLTIPGHQDAQIDDLALGIRTARWVETLIASNTPQKRDEITAAIFCEPSSDDAAKRKTKTTSDWPKKFTRGPFKSIGNLRGSALTSVCSRRIESLLSKLPKSMAQGGDSAFPLSAKSIMELRNAFPPPAVIADLKKWLLRTYADSCGLLEQAESLLRAPHAHTAVLSDSEGESQESVVRMPAGQRSVFQSRSDILRLYQDSQPFSQDGGDDEDDDDEDEDAFETDPHFNSNGKRHATASSSQATPAKRAKHRPPSSREQMPPPPLPRSINKNLNVLRPSPGQAAAAAAAPARHLRDEETPQGSSAIPRPPGATIAYKSRQAWDQRDSDTLIELIGSLGKKGTLWAKIEQAYNHRFQWPRNEQAYRDKARNLKVDLLLADAPLPTNFDIVALHKKERKKIMDHGKNPWRTEMDVDERGRPVNVNLGDAPVEDEGLSGA